jgi:hypothetical protein
VTTRTQTDRATAEARAMLQMLRARYDGGAVAPAIYKTIRELESDIAWAEHEGVRNGR